MRAPFQRRGDTQAKPSEARGIVANRMVRYGHPRQNFDRIAKMWEPILGRKISAEQVGLCMLAVKLARLVNKPDDKDSLDDIAGYALTMQMLADSCEKTKR